MSHIKIVTILGARPQFVKAGALSRKLKIDKEINEILVHTGQHYDNAMSEVFFEELQLPKPQYNLALGGLSHGAMTGRMLEKIEEILSQEKPHFTLVYGDTDSTLAGALASVKLHIPIIHIEAGLRSFNLAMPEEINRILTDRISKILFVPTTNAMQNLKNEGFLNFDCKIVQSGDIMQDVALYYTEFAKAPAINLAKEFALCTIHRAENTDSILRLKEIFAGLDAVAREIQVILPLHPRTRKILEQNNIEIPQRVVVTPPLGYLEMVYLLQSCKMVLTDSGGLQKEAYFFKKPCLILRDETEWVELVEKGYNTIVGADREKIIQGFLKTDNNPMEFCSTLYGGGNAAEMIIQTIKEEAHKSFKRGENEKVWLNWCSRLYRSASFKGNQRDK